MFDYCNVWDEMYYISVIHVSWEDDAFNCVCFDLVGASPSVRYEIKQNSTCTYKHGEHDWVLTTFRCINILQGLFTDGNHNVTELGCYAHDKAYDVYNSVRAELTVTDQEGKTVEFEKDSCIQECLNVASHERYMGVVSTNTHIHVQ